MDIKTKRRFYSSPCNVLVFFSLHLAFRSSHALKGKKKFSDLDRDESDRGVKYRSYFGNALHKSKEIKK